MSGAAAPSGLNAVAAAHNPALATIPMLNRSKIVINVNSSPTAHGPPQLTVASNWSSVDAENEHAAPDRFQTVTWRRFGANAHDDPNTATVPPLRLPAELDAEKEGRHGCGRRRL